MLQLVFLPGSELFVLQAGYAADGAAEGAALRQVGNIVDNPAGNAGQVKAFLGKRVEINHHRIRSDFGRRVTFDFKAPHAEVHDHRHSFGSVAVHKKLMRRDFYPRKLPAFNAGIYHGWQFRLWEHFNKNKRVIRKGQVKRYELEQ